MYTHCPAVTACLVCFSVVFFTLIAVAIFMAGVARLERPHSQGPPRGAAGGTRHGSETVPPALRPRERRRQLQLRLRLHGLLVHALDISHVLLQ